MDIHFDVKITSDGYPFIVYDVKKSSIVLKNFRRLILNVEPDIFYFSEHFTLKNHVTPMKVLPR